jgi:hypothetical protein
VVEAFSRVLFFITSVISKYLLHISKDSHFPKSSLLGTGRLNLFTVSRQGRLNTVPHMICNKQTPNTAFLSIRPYRLEAEEESASL